jgi:hypothetical protein
MSAAQEDAWAVIDAFRTGWESAGQEIGRDAMRKHALLMAGIQRLTLEKHPDSEYAQASLEAYERIALAYALGGPADPARAAL